ncbi:MAG TPA: DMT family transporter, partial [Candidatus Limnocylindria bacterium]|nr:DMT family transporter [Candidatus Limnocylindria bacterium]
CGYDRAITPGQRLLTIAAYVTVALCWSGSWTAGKLGVEAIPPLELSSIRFAIAGVLMLAIARVTGAPLGLAKLPLVVLAAAFGIFGYNALVFVALTMTPASDGALIVPTINPVLTVLFASFIGERLTANKLVGLAIATLGALVVIAAATGLTFTGERLVGDLLLLGGAACWSVYAVLGSITTRHGSPLGVTAVACLAGAAMLFPLGFLEHGYADVPSWPLTAWLNIAYLVVFATIIGFVLFYWAVRRFGAGMASMVSYLVPIFALIQAVTILDEHPEPLEIVGGGIILVGVRVATLRFKLATPLEDAAPA